MSLRTVAESDSTAILSADGDPAILISPASTEYPINLRYLRRGVDVDVNTGLPAKADISVFTASLSALVLLGVDYKTFDTPGWKIRVSDVTGETNTMAIYKSLLDRTIGRVTFFGRVV